MKICSKCGVEKPLTSFSKSREKKDGLQSRCKECDGEYRKSGHERIMKYAKDYREQNRERIKANCGSYYHRNREMLVGLKRTYREANRELVNSTAKTYRDRNPEAVRATNQRQRARRRGAKGSFTLEQWLGRRAFHGNKCVYCGDTEDLQIEHQIPLARGGTNWPANLVPACPSCNYRKSTKTPREFHEFRDTSSS